MTSVSSSKGTHSRCSVVSFWYSFLALGVKRGCYLWGRPAGCSLPFPSVVSRRAFARISTCRQLWMLVWYALDQPWIPTAGTRLVYLLSRLAECSTTQQHWSEQVVCDVCRRQRTKTTIPSAHGVRTTPASVAAAAAAHETRSGFFKGAACVSEGPPEKKHRGVHK